MATAGRIARITIQCPRFAVAMVVPTETGLIGYLRCTHPAMLDELLERAETLE